MDVKLISSDVLLDRIISCLPLLADISRADLLLYSCGSADRMTVIAQARPHSIPPLYTESLVGQEFAVREMPPAFAQLGRSLYRSRPMAAVLANGAPIMREVRPVRNPASGHIIGALSIETNLLAHERHMRRRRSFQRAIRQLQGTVLRGELEGAEQLSPFGEHDGIYLVDTQRRIQYVSGIATNFFRWLGYVGPLVGISLDSLNTADRALVKEALETQRCIEREDEEQGLIWIRKVLPVRERRDWLYYSPWLRSFVPNSAGSYPVGALVTIHDETETRRQEQEIKIKIAMMQEVHHRVKNNLQTIASLLRLQSRRVAAPEMRTILQESINRILSIAVVHEFLSQGGNSAINVKEVGRRIIMQMQESLIDPSKRLEFELEGPNIYLPARHATACALIMNELLQNAVEHGYVSRNMGHIKLSLVDEGRMVHLRIQDDGEGLPPHFDLSQADSLGLSIVKTLVQEDLRGEIVLASETTGTCAFVSFPKQIGDG